MFWRDYPNLPDHTPEPVTVFSLFCSEWNGSSNNSVECLEWNGLQANPAVSVHQIGHCLIQSVSGRARWPLFVRWCLFNLAAAIRLSHVHKPHPKLREFVWDSFGRTFEVQNNSNHPPAADWFVLELQLLKVHCLRGWLACGTPSGQCGNCRTSYGSAPVRTGKVLRGWLKSSVSEVYVCTYRFFMILPTGFTAVEKGLLPCRDFLCTSCSSMHHTEFIQKDQSPRCKDSCCKVQCIWYYLVISVAVLRCCISSLFFPVCIVSYVFGEKEQHINFAGPVLRTSFGKRQKQDSKCIF